MQDVLFSSLDFADPDEIKRIARIHQGGPLEWIQGYQVGEEAVGQTYKVLSESLNNPKTHVIVARDEAGVLLGFHWVSVTTEHDETSGRIESLWTIETQRRRGIARQLKKRGEVWMKEHGAKRVTTAVFYVNKKMIEFNLKEGFTPGQVQMMKEL